VILHFDAGGLMSFATSAGVLYCGNASGYFETVDPASITREGGGLWGKSFFRKPPFPIHESRVDPCVEVKLLDGFGPAVS
jgi:hypothetical protein